MKSILHVISKSIEVDKFGRKSFFAIGDLLQLEELKSPKCELKIQIGETIYNKIGAGKMLEIQIRIIGE